MGTSQLQGLSEPLLCQPSHERSYISAIAKNKVQLIFFYPEFKEEKEDREWHREKVNIYKIISHVSSELGQDLLGYEQHLMPNFP